jgi:CubicO group peptidase (beta-lactamase class C family)
MRTLSGLNALTSRLEQANSETGLPALAAARIADGETDVAAAGVRRLGDAAEVEQADAFHLGSHTKAMTATLAGIAVDEGRLGWGTEREGVTLEQLLQHAAGLPPYTEDDDLQKLPPFDGSPRAQRAAFAELVLAGPRVFAPGSGHAYSNAGYAIASALIEDAYDDDFERLLRDKLFAPLEMDGGFDWPAAGDAPAPSGHRQIDGAFVPHELSDGYVLPPILAPAGDVHAPIGGYARFVEAHLEGLRGRSSVVSAATFEKLHDASGGFALGWGVQELLGEETHVHSGSAETFFALVALQPRRRRAAAVVTNAAGPEVDRVLPALLKELLV